MSDMTCEYAEAIPAPPCVLAAALTASEQRVAELVASGARSEAAFRAERERNRELQSDWQRKNEQVIRLVARLEAAEKLVDKWRNGYGESFWALRYADELEAAISPTPAQPAAGEGT